jgi:hypothetical protein
MPYGDRLKYRHMEQVATMLTIHLDPESEKYLQEILATEETSSDEIIKRLLKEYWSARQSSQPPKTVLERLGGYPKNVITADKNLSDRDQRKNIITEKLKQRYGSI